MQQFQLNARNQKRQNRTGEILEGAQRGMVETV
jgi:hypothetical protein